MDKLIIEAKKIKTVLLTIQYVFRANFNDTYWLEEKEFVLENLDTTKLTWFDPFNGRSKINDTTVAIKYVSDETFTILENKNGVIKEYSNKPYIDYIACEDYNESVMLAAHIRCR